ncbi:hypothetical protein N9E50_02410 [Alphaproteobacteria bacterium]|nr:hypothetical protein [Alphaproteobacteria bacterium]
MCGIFFIKYDLNNTYKPNLKLDIIKCFKHLGRRGRDSSGILLIFENKLLIIKSNSESKDLFKSSLFNKEVKNFNKLFKSKKKGEIFVIGHTRMITHGDPDDKENNQPIINKEGIVIHNGIVTNYDTLKNKFNKNLNTSVDSEIFLHLFNNNDEDKENLDIFKKNINYVKGANNFILINLKLKKIFVFTSNNSLHYAKFNNEIEFYSSESILLKKFFGKQNQKLKKIELTKNKIYNHNLNFQSKPEINIKYIEKKHKLIKQNNKISEIKNILLNKVDLIRCKKCVLPSTFPFIKFNSDGICNICINYEYKKEKGEKLLCDKISKFNKPKLLVPLSGGRDSCYALHYLNKIKNFKTIAYTYDWGFITDVARKNISNICGNLGVEHILVSANIRKKRENVHNNILAWSKKPHLGMIPLFMAGDKQFFYFAEKIRQENNCTDIIFGQNKFEETNFKSGFIGINDFKYKKHNHYYDFNYLGKISILFKYLVQFINNPSYFNSSIYDSFAGYLSYYFFPKRFIHFYDYIKWDEKKILKTLKSEYDWNEGVSNSTWRIGDSTSSFYNLIYLSAVGFTENDTFRSNQIRNNLISRDEALKNINHENFINFNLVKEYLDKIGIDIKIFKNTINDLNKIKNLK